MPEPPDVDLSGAWMKLDRARKHQADLAAEIAAFMAREPFSTRHTTEPGEGGVTVHHVFADLLELPPALWSPIIGDAVHNLRSALDHALWALADPLVRDPRAQYPVYDSEEKYERAAANLLRGVSDRRRELIWGTQPFRWVESKRVWHGLWRLHDFDITDKHKTLHAITAVSEFQSIATGNTDINPTYLVGEWEPLADGVEVLTFETEPLDPSKPVVATPSVDYAVSIEGDLGTPLLDRLRGLDHFVEWDVLRPLEHPDDPMFAALPLVDVWGQT